jgi:hypothetical protein
MRACGDPQDTWTFDGFVTFVSNIKLAAMDGTSNPLHALMRPIKGRHPENGSY